MYTVRFDKRLLLMLVFFVSLIFVLAGCQSSPATSAPKTSPATTVPAASGVKVSISLASPNVASGETFTADIVINSEIPLRGAQCALSFDPALMKCDSVMEGSFFKDWAAANDSSTVQIPQPDIDNVSGKVSDIGVAIMGTNVGGAKGIGVFCTYTFTALANGVAAPTLSDVLLSDENGKVFTVTFNDK